MNTVGGLEFFSEINPEMQFKLNIPEIVEDFSVSEKPLDFLPAVCKTQHGIQKNAFSTAETLALDRPASHNQKLLNMFDTHYLQLPWVSPYMESATPANHPLICQICIHRTYSCYLSSSKT